MCLQGFELWHACAKNHATKSESVACGACGCIARDRSSRKRRRIWVRVGSCEELGFWRTYERRSRSWSLRATTDDGGENGATPIELHDFATAVV
ncbi:hypothetical protein RIF29_20418 [Crotalaria pallida]|uniref:Uncharacterized protein n=1 Tax=Crotalaria pallida TaxID=3830 RepID=A0AAN9F2X8_CROPI